MDIELSELTSCDGSPIPVLAGCVGGPGPRGLGTCCGSYPTPTFVVVDTDRDDYCVLSNDGWGWGGPLYGESAGAELSISGGIAPLDSSFWSALCTAWVTCW